MRPRLSSEEKLLRAIFGEKASDVQDTSLRVPPGVEGTVIDAKIFIRKGSEKDSRSQFIEDEALAHLQKDRDDEIKIVTEAVKNKVHAMLVGKMSAAKLVDPKKKKSAEERGHSHGRGPGSNPLFALERNIDPERYPDGGKINALLSNLSRKVEFVEALFEERKEKLKAGHELPPGVIKLVKVYIAIKRKLSVGDKMAGRHGNKGVLSRILPEEDMPYFSDGTPVDIILNPLGVPSRMNVGQILETHLGWAAKGLGEQISALMEKHYSLDSLKKS